MSADDSHVNLRAEVRDRTYLPASDAKAEAHILGRTVSPNRSRCGPIRSSRASTRPIGRRLKPGSYLVEVIAKRGTEELGRDTMTFRREDGVAENFHIEQNRDLLEKLSSETGGRYYTPEDAEKLGKDISYSEAGITVRETRDLWDMPVVFLMLLCCARREWLLRRKWGVI